MAGRSLAGSGTWMRAILSGVNSLSKDGANERTGKPLAPKTIRHNLSFVSDVFAYAVKMGVVSDNPCSKVTLPKNEQTEKKIYTHEQVQKFLSLLNDEPLKYRTFFNLMIYSGFRCGEMQTLKCGDIFTAPSRLCRASLYQKR